MHLMAPRHALAALAMLAAPFAAASPFLLPEGTRELAVGAALVNSEDDLGSRTRSTYVQPYFKGQWSNGLFMQGLWLGMQLAPTPGVQAGPLLTVARRAGAAPGSDARVMPVFGAFANVQLLHNLQFAAHGYRIAGSRGGAEMSMQLATYRSLAPHHAVVLAAGVRLADRHVLQRQLGAAPDASGGIKNSHVEGRWDWEVTPKYTASAGVQARRLHGDAALGALVTRRTGLGYSLMLVRSY